jgi:hypothetical protein
MRFGVLLLSLALLAQQPDYPPRLPLQISDIPSGEPLGGRIVLFAWWLRWLNAGDDFVVRVVEKDGTRRYVRVIYVRNPQAPKGDYPLLDPRAFVGKGPPWTFYVVMPQSPIHAELQCRIQPDYAYKDGNETGTIPAYIRTPGAERDEIPALETLPCYLLVRKGLVPPPGADSGVLDPKDGSVHLTIPVVATTEPKQ